jgi:hypothetical protein
MTSPTHGALDRIDFGDRLNHSFRAKSLGTEVLYQFGAVDMVRIVPSSKNLRLTLAL